MAYPPWKFLVIDCNSKILPDMPFFLFQLFSSYTTFENNSFHHQPALPPSLHQCGKYPVTLDDRAAQARVPCAPHAGLLSVGSQKHNTSRGVSE
jgi:hypothetical protein